MKLPTFTLLFLFTFLISTIAQAQFEVVEYSPAEGWFNNGQPLPAESNLILTGSVPPEVDLLIVSLFKAGQAGQQAPQYQTEWQRLPQQDDGMFRLPIAYPLKGNSGYDIEFQYYETLGPKQRDPLVKDIYEALKRYLEQQAPANGPEQSLQSSSGRMVRELNELVQKQLQGYRLLQEPQFPGFSATLRQALDNLRDLEGTIPAGEASDKAQQRQQAYEQQRQAVIDLIRAEWMAYADQPILQRNQRRVVNNYQTESTRNPIAINAGFGGVYLGGNVENLSYGTSPYLGISLPLSNRSTAPTFFRNTSVSMGVFVNNFENEAQETITGPVFGRPYYLGLGYNLFRFIRINVGATALETQGASSVGNGSAGLDVNAISIQPFVGLSAELDLWLGLRNR